MGSSASNLVNNKGSENITFFHTSDDNYSSDCGIYNSTGQLLKGRKLFENYADLAKQIDTKRSAFYLELKKNEIVFGCSLTVKTENGREERVVFIQVSKNLPTDYNIETNIDLLRKFYQEIEVNVENLEFKKYRLVGLWNEGDFLNIQEIPINNKDSLKYTLGKILHPKSVYIKISELSIGLSFILELVPKLKVKSSFVFDVSHYPSESNVSISLIKPNPDFEIGKNGEWQDFSQTKLRSFYTEIGEEFLRGGNQNQQDFVSLLIQRIKREPSSSNSIFNDLDEGDKIEILKGLIQEVVKEGLKKSDIEVFRSLYQKTKTEETKYEIQKTLISKNIYFKELIKDIVISIYADENTDLLSLLFKVKISQDYSQEYDFDNIIQHKKPLNSSKRSTESNSFEKGIKAALEGFSYPQKVDFVKFIVNNIPINSKINKKNLLDILIEDLVKAANNDFLLKLSDEEVERLDLILPGRRYLASKKEKQSRNMRNLINAGFMIAGFLILSFLIYILLTGDINLIISKLTSLVEYLRGNSNSTLINIT